MTRFALHHETNVTLDATPDVAFAYLDDFSKLSAHMAKRSLMMMGSSMRIATDELEGRAIGSKVRMEGRMLGMSLSLKEVVTVREPPLRKAWETIDTDLLVIGPYRLGFELAPTEHRTRLRVFIDYDLPRSGPARLLGRLLGKVYARWCTERMARDASHNFESAPRRAPAT